MRWLDRLLALCVAVAVLANLLPLGARWLWTLELTAHFRVQYVVLDVLLLAVFACRRDWLWTGALLAGAAMNAIWIAPYVAVGQRAVAAVSPAASGAPPIEVMAANVFFRNHSARRLLELVREESPDVLLLSEYTHEWAANVDELRRDYPYHVELPEWRADGIALYSRFPFDGAEIFALGTMPAIEARVLTPSGPLTIFGVHLRSPSSPRRAAHRDRQLRLLADRIATRSGPVAVVGDLNITPYSPPYGNFLRRTGFTDTRIGRTLRPSWPTYLPIFGIPIDHCIVSPDVTILAHRTLRRIGSDHYPILAELALPPPKRSSGDPGHRWNDKTSP
jgi:endonuclease/exonuclease/phosphatase (EEP) superfamily protein YafD